MYLERILITKSCLISLKALSNFICNTIAYVGDKTWLVGFCFFFLEVIKVVENKIKGEAGNTFCCRGWVALFHQIGIMVVILLFQICKYTWVYLISTGRKDLVCISCEWDNTQNGVIEYSVLTEVSYYWLINIFG